MVEKLFVLVLIVGLVGWLEVPALLRQKKRRTLWVLIVILALGLSLNILERVLYVDLSALTEWMIAKVPEG